MNLGHLHPSKQKELMMSRPLRIEYAGAWYHVMNRGLNYQDIFHNNKEREMFLELLIEIHNRYRIEIHAYCLMSNHYHLLVRTPLGNLSRGMRHLNSIYTQRYNSLTKRDGSLFRGRYKSILIDADEYLVQVSRYIHLNPVVAGLVKQAEKYRWSSYKMYLSKNTQSFSDWLQTKNTLDYFGKYQQREKYKAFVEEGIDEEIDGFYKKLKQLPILAGDSFIKATTEKYLEERHKVREIPDHKLLETNLAIESIMTLVANYYEIPNANLREVKKRGGNQPRAVGMYLSQQIGRHKLKEIAEAFTQIGAAGVSQTCRRMELQMERDLQLRKAIQYLKNKLK